MKRTISFVIFLIFILVSGIAPLYSQEAEEEKSTFVVSFYPSDLELNPIHTFTSTEAQIYTAIYEGLVIYNPLSLEPVPGVARRWDVLDDGKRYRFYLREDAFFWNGDKVKAEHFKNTWLKLLDPDEQAEYSFLFDIIKGASDYRLGKNPDPNSVGIETPSDYILDIVLESPATHFLKILCHHSFVPVHPDLLHVRDWTEKTSIFSNGPYYIFERTDEEVLLKKNQLYWDEKNIKIPNIRIIFQDDPEKATLMFNQGDIHWVGEGMNIELVQNTDSVIVNPLFATSYFYFSSETPPFNDTRVRRGLALLLPWNEIRNEEFQFLPATTLVPPIPYYPQAEGIESSAVDEGLALLREAGYLDGKEFPELTMKIPIGLESERIVTLMVDTWKKYLNISPKVEVYDYPSYFEELKKPGFAIGTLTWIGDFADPLTFLQMWTSDSNLNDSKYKNKLFDDLIKESMGQKGQERYDTLSEAETMLLEGAIVLPINHSPAVNLIDLEYIEGWFPNPLDIHPFKFFRFAEYKPIPGIAQR